MKINIFIEEDVLIKDYQQKMELTKALKELSNLTKKICIRDLDCIKNIL